MSREALPSIRFIGRERISGFVFTLLNVLTFGAAYVICRLIPWAEIWMKTVDCELSNADCVVIEDQYGGKSMFTVRKLAVAHTLGLCRYTKGGVCNILNTPYGRFIFDYKVGKYVSPAYSRSSKNGLDGEYRTALTKTSYEEGLELYEKSVIYGDNDLRLELLTYAEIIRRRIFNFIFLWKLLSMAVWISIQYYFYATVVGIIYCFAFWKGLTVDIRARTEQKRRNTIGETKVLRGGKFTTVSELDIFPGDIICVGASDSFQCDAEILKGNVISDESYLTGETVPICKGPGDIVFGGTRVIKSTSSSILESGSNLHKLVRVKNLLKKESGRGMETEEKSQNAEEGAIGIVLRTGKKTKKGAMLKTIYNKKPVSNAFVIQSRIVMKALFLIAIFTMITVYIYLSFYIPHRACVRYVLDLALGFFSPALYSSLEMGIQHAQKELKKKKIHTTDSERINTAGEVDVAVFDKTGTLTELGVDILCVDTLDARVDRADELDETVLTGLSTCHGVMELDGKYSGDTLDMKMFVFSRSQLVTRGGRRTVVLSADAALRPICREEPHEGEGVLFFEASASHAGGPAVEVVRTYDFDAGLKRMSVVVQTADGRRVLYCKGAPDSVAGILAEQPAAYADRVHEYGLQGYRVLALACRELGGEPQGRAEDERALRFCGLIVFANRLKAEAPAVVGELRAAGLCPRMCTGDGIVTAISIARECGMIERDMPVLFPLIEDDDGTVGDAEWCCIANEDYVFDRVRMSLYAEMDRGTPVEFVLACGGKEYAGLRETAYFRFILERGVVFARFTPENKKTLIEDYGRAQMTTLYCGDGANDTGALSAADVGLALATNEASLAASFSSSELTAAVELVKEGRSALAMSAAQFKYMLYSQVLCGVQMLSLLLFFYFPSDRMSVVSDLMSCYVLGASLYHFKSAQFIHGSKIQTDLRADCALVGLELFITLLIFLGVNFFMGLPVVSSSIRITSLNSGVIFISIMAMLVAKAFFLADFGPHREKRSANPIFLVIIAIAALFSSAIIFLMINNASTLVNLFQYYPFTRREVLISLFALFLILLNTWAFSKIHWKKQAID